MTEQTVKFATKKSAREFYETEGKRLGYDEPYEGCDGWHRCTRLVPIR